VLTSSFKVEASATSGDSRSKNVGVHCGAKEKVGVAA